MLRKIGITGKSVVRRLVFGCCFLVAFAPTTLVAGEQTRVLRIGTSGDYAPFSESMESPPGYRGFDISVAEAFAREREYEIEWVEFRWPQLAADMRSNLFDLAMSGITVRPDRSALGRFSVPVMSSGAVLLFAVASFENAVSFPQVASASALALFDRPGVRVAVNRGGHLERVTRAHFKQAAVRSIPDNAAVRQALVEGSADVIVTDTLEAPTWRRGLEQVSQFGPWTRDRKAYWVAPDKVALSRELDAWLMARESDGTLSRLRRSAFAGTGSEATAYALEALLAAIDERLALMSWVAESKRRSGVAVEDRAQEQRVLEAGLRSVRAAADRAGVEAPPAATVRAFYRAQIGAAKAIQRRTLSGTAKHEALASDLSQILRPALIRIGDRMAQLIVALHQEKLPALPAHRIERALRARELEQPFLDDIGRTIAGLAATGLR